MAKKRELTEIEKAAQIRLRAAWDAWSAEDSGRTQQSVSGQLEMAQTSLGHYLNGRNPLNVEFLLRICSLMRVDPVSIYPEAFDGIDFSVVKAADGLSELIDILKNASTEQINAVKAISRQVV